MYMYLKEQPSNKRAAMLLPMWAVLPVTIYSLPMLSPCIEWAGHADSGVVYTYLSSEQ